ncbi:MAG: beta-ketoacyl synthase N-terminal-like domain-containing protein [Pseudobdellovibrio sp.]
MDLLYYDCITAAGEGPKALMQALDSGVDCSRQVESNEWNQPVASNGRVCFLPNTALKNRNYQKDIKLNIEKIWSRIHGDFSDSFKEQFKKSKALIILASTKGLVEDYIWNYKSNPNAARAAQNPYSEIVKYFKTTISQLTHPLDTLVVSNACASSHVAIEMAKLSIDSGNYDYVIVLSVDLIGPFIYQGFQSLKVLSTTLCKPFAQDRDGLQLGEAIAILLFSKKNKIQKTIRIHGVSSETEGGSVTRPSVNGESLLRTMRSVMKSGSGKIPSFFVAHGTGTKFNDASEELAIKNLNAELNIKAPVVGIKWSVGHTLGASGALDLITASEVLKNKKLFKIQNTKQIDRVFETNFLIQQSKISNLPEMKCAMISSLGFGGVHAALLIGAPEND